MAIKSRLPDDDDEVCLNHSERIVALETHIDDVRNVLKETNTKLDNLLHEITRYKGFMGGISFIFSGVAVAWMFLGDWIKDHWK